MQQKHVVTNELKLTNIVNNIVRVCINVTERVCYI